MKGRARAIRRAYGLSETAEMFADRLNAAAANIGGERHWKEGQVTAVETGRRLLSAEDALVYAHLDKQTRGWTWIMRGVPLAKGDDAWNALARQTKKTKQA